MEDKTLVSHPGCFPHPYNYVFQQMTMTLTKIYLIEPTVRGSCGREGRFGGGGETLF